jgi:transcriptional regulator with XRE-family HTH domain
MPSSDTLHRRSDLPGYVDDVSQHTLGGRLAWSRMRKKMTQKELADAANKARATIVQYENDNIQPPIDVVAVLAEKLGVSPSYLAYGEHVVSGMVHKDTEMVSFPELSVGRDGTYTSSTFAFPKELIESYGVDTTSATLNAYVLATNAPAFEFASGDRVFVDTTITVPDTQHDMYLLKTRTGVEIVRVEPDFGSGASKEVRFTSSKGVAGKSKLADLTIIGAIVASLRAR